MTDFIIISLAIFINSIILIFRISLQQHTKENCHNRQYLLPIWNDIWYLYKRNAACADETAQTAFLLTEFFLTSKLLLCAEHQEFLRITDENRITG